MPVSSALYESPTPIDYPVRVEVLSREDCCESPLLEQLECHDNSPARKAVNEIRTNLLTGNAQWEQTATFLVEEITDTPLAMGTLCLDGDPRRQQEPDLLRRLNRTPYINLVFRGEHQHNKILIDGKTRVGTAILWALIELAIRERPGSNGATPRIHALVHSWNDLALRAFKSALFAAHKLERQPGVFEVLESGIAIPAQAQMAVVREAGEPLPHDRDFNAYHPLLGVLLPASGSLGPQRAATTPPSDAKDRRSGADLVIPRP